MNRRQATHLAFKASRHFLAPCGRVKFDVLGILALVFASATTATGDDDICGPDALRLLTSTDYEHNIWKSLEQLRVPECVDQICIVEVGDGRKPDSVPYDRIEVDRQSTVVVYAPHIRASASTDESLATVRIFGLDGELLGQRNLD